jgi:hypothetical protein
VAVDADGDGHPAAEDCDDADPAVHPGAEEVCDGQDNNCVDGVDEGLGSWWYVDGDGDGYGDESSAVLECEAPTGWIGLGGDCNDSNSLVHPDRPETCSDGIDADCDGSDCTTEVARPEVLGLYSVIGAGSGDKFGFHLYGGDFNADGQAELLISAPQSYVSASPYGALWVVDPRFDSEGRAVGTSTDGRLVNDQNYTLGMMELTSLPDVEGGPGRDLVVGLGFRYEASGTYPVGAVALLDGEQLYSGMEEQIFEHALFYAEGGANDYLGMGVATGDVDADGSVEIFAGRPAWDGGAIDGGGIVVVSDPGGSNTVTSFAGGVEDEWAGAALAVLDLDGDGIDDLVVGAPGEFYDAARPASWADQTYALHVVMGDHGVSWADSGALGDWATRVPAANPGYPVGAFLAVAGDTDADGKQEVLIGEYAHGMGHLSNVFLAEGSPGATVDSWSMARFEAPALQTNLGWNLVDGGDLDGDGFDDVALPAVNYVVGSLSYAGGVWLHFGPFSGTYMPHAAPLELQGSADYDQLGAGLAILDGDRDGLAELYVGRPGHGHSETGGAGTVFALTGW